VSGPAITGTGCLPATSGDAPAVLELLRGERLRALNLETRLLLAAARLALRDAAVGDGAIARERLGVAVATCRAGEADYADLLLAALDPDRPPVSPARGPQTGINAPAAVVSIRLGARGPNATLSNGAVGGLDALRYAADALAAGRAAAMVVGAVERVQADEPAGTAAALVLEACPRTGGARARALLAGVATAFAAGERVARTRERARRSALARAAVEDGDVETLEDAVGAGVDSVAAVVRLVEAAERLHRGAARGPLVVGAADAGGGAGAAVLVKARREADACA